MHATQWPSVELQYGVRPPHMPSPLQGVAAAPALPPPGVVELLPPPGFVVPVLSPPPPGFVVPVLSPPPPGFVLVLLPVLFVEAPVPEEAPPLPPLFAPESLLPQPLIANAKMTPTVPTIT
jgi:hypothetical protein